MIPNPTPFRAARALRLCVFLLFIAALLPVSFAIADPLTGTFSDGRLTLTLEGGQGGYTGTAQMDGASYPLTARGTAQNLQGTYRDAGGSYPFQAALKGNVLTLLTGGATYSLQKWQAAAPKSPGPLAQPAPQTPKPAAPQTTPQESAGRFTKKEDGFSLALAGGFFQINNQDGAYLLGSKTTPGLILVRPEPSLTPADVEEGMRSGHQEEGVNLVPSGSPETLKVKGGTGKMVPVTGTLDGAQVQGILAGFTAPSGPGLVVTALTTPEQWPNLKASAHTAIEDVHLFAPSVAPLVRQWDQKLRGMKMTYMSTFGDYQGGGSTKIVYALCSDSSFSYSGSDSMSFDIDAGFGSSHSRAGGAGTWSIRSQGGQPTIHFAFNDGNQRTFQLSRQGSKTFLDNTRYFVTANDICR